MNAKLLLRSVGAGGLLMMTVLAHTDAAAQTLSPNSDPAATLEVGARYRNLNNGSGGAAEVLVFPSPCCTTTTNGQGTWPASSMVSMTYNGTSLSTTAAGTTTTRAVGAFTSLNYIQITITKNSPTTSVALNAISVNGGSSLGNVAVNSAPNTRVWKITGADLTSGFTLTANLVLTGLSGGGDSSFVQIEVGSVPPVDNVGPTTSSVATSPVPALLNGTVTVTANVSDALSGNNNIGSAEYSIDGGGWTLMDAQDGAFDTPDEDVQASFTATEVGRHQVCVRGADALGNMGTSACEYFLVTYKFAGFFEPINNDFLNMVKAGQAIPAKWRLTDANDVPVSDPGTFVGLFSYPISCTDFTGDPTDAVEEVASGSSGLQYLGDGYWQFNWKTPKSYGDCRTMYVEFDSGATSPVVKFKFRK